MTVRPFDLEYELDDRYAREQGRVFVNGDQALVRLLLMQHRRDRQQGLRTGGFVSGYRGSPLGVLDLALWGAASWLKEQDIHFQPGVNEELAATAVWGTQQLGLLGETSFDGVFGMWYGKGPGVDRAGDAIKTANYHGSARYGGVLALCGDDHGARSSSLAHQSEQALISFGMPVLNPSSIQEYIDLGLYGYALSRFSGCWVGFICVTDTVETSASVAVDDDRVVIRIPELDEPQSDRNMRRVAQVEAERLLYNHRLPAAQAFVRLNRLDRPVFGDPSGRLGIVTCGKAYGDVRQALQSLDIDDRRAQAMGLGIYKVAMTWPLEPVGIRAFAAGKQDLLVIEEKRSLVEDQLKTLLFEDGPGRPQVAGKQDWDHKPLIPNYGELSSVDLARSIARWITHATGEVLEPPRDPRIHVLGVGAGPGLVRTAAFCSGCPHNISTKVPEGSLAMGGIGCHGMAAMLPDRNTFGATPMGSEGANWIGQAPFSEKQHIFQNLGDGTYFHSGILAIRASLASGVNVTYKILANDAVAMTGGQPVEGVVTAPQIARQVAAEGVKKIAVVSDQPDKYPRNSHFPAGVTIHDRSELDRLQREFREITGTTVIIYDQACAAELRRRRKRRQVAEPTKRVIINEQVCEGCGDCNVQSNCISLEPVETEFGRKRRVNQSSCNKDYSCLDGYCPSFVTVYGGQVRGSSPSPSAHGADGGPGAVNGAGAGAGDQRDRVARAVARLGPDAPEFGPDQCSILVTGVGGAGIVTLGSVLAMAAHLEGRSVSVLNVLGMAQKNGPVTSHVRVSRQADDVVASRIGPGEADVILGTDPVVSTSPESIVTVSAGHTAVILNEHVQPTADFATHPDLVFDVAPIRDRLARACGASGLYPIQATRWATVLFGDAILANMVVLGVTAQLGQLPVGVPSLHRAIELNGQSVPQNLLAFDLGRLAVVDRAQVEELVSGGTPASAGAGPAAPAVDHSLAGVVARNAAFLTRYQDQAYAGRYQAAVERIARREQQVTAGESERLALAVARYYFKLLAYKDEYEVARLLSDPAFREQLDREFEGDFRIAYLAPQLLNRRDPLTGRAQKRTFGPWVFPVLRVLAEGRRLRGTALDVFGRTAHRRRERSLIVTYEEWLGAMERDLSTANYETAIQLAEVPESIRGFDTVKDDSIDKALSSVEELHVAFRSAGPVMA